MKCLKQFCIYLYSIITYGCCSKVLYLKSSFGADFACGDAMKTNFKINQVMSNAVVMLLLD